MINFLKKFKRWIISFLIGGTALAAGLSGIPQDIYNNLNVKVYTVCDQTPARASIGDDLQTFKARNPDNSLRGLNTNEKASLKSCEIAKRGNEFAGIYNSAQYGTQIEIIGEVKAIEVNGQHGVEVFAKAWRGSQQLGFGKDGSVEIERFRIFNPPILVDDPNGTIIREWTDEITGELKQRKLREDLLEATRQVIAHNAQLVGIENAPIVIGKIGNTTSTFYPDADPESTSVDGYMQANNPSNQTWGNIITDTGDNVNDSGASLYLLHWDSATSGQTDKWNSLIRSIILFDTSAIGDTDTIDSSTISFYGQSKVDQDSYANQADINIYSATPASNTSLVAGDFDSLGSTALSDNAITYTNFSTTGYNDFALNASGLANITKTGVSKFGTRSPSRDVGASSPIWSVDTSIAMIAYSADQTGTANDPKLVVVHSAASAGVNKSYIIIEE